MARAQRASSVLETTRRRLAGLKSITPAPDFGSALSIRHRCHRSVALGQ